MQPHDTTPKRRPLEDRFWEKVDKAGPCWLWTASKDRKGYGRIMRPGGRGGPLLATRVSWELHYGPIPDGLFVCHHCDNPSCVRPDHLFLGDQFANMGDCSAKGRMHPGEQNGGAKLTEDDVREIRRRYRAGGISQSALAREYGLCQASVHELISGKTWRHVHDVKVGAT